MKDFIRNIVFICKGSKGQSLIELMVTIGLMAVLIPALFAGFAASRNGRAQQEKRFQAIQYLREGEEAARVYRDANWDSFALLSGQTAYAKVNGTTWQLTTTPQSLTGFTRTIQVSDVYRNSGGFGNIVSSGGTLDPSTKKVVTTVSWTSPLSSSVTATEYLTRNQNEKYIQTTYGDGSVTDFATAVTKTNVVIRSTTPPAVPNDGEVTLALGPAPGDWCSPQPLSNTVDLPKNGVANGIYAIQGTAFAATGDNSSGVSFAKVDVTDNTNPKLMNTYNGFKTNGIFGETNYAYLATATNSKEIDIIDLTKIVNGQYQEAGYFDAPGNGNGNSVYVFNSIGFMTDGSKLYTFDLSSRIGSRSQLGSVNLAGTGNRVFVVQDPTSHMIYAYVATSSTSSQLQIFSISSDGKTITVVGSKGLNAQGAVDLFVSSDGSRVYLATAYVSGQSNLFILNTSNKGSISLLSSTNTSNMNPKGITVIQNRAIVVGTGGTNQYQVYKVDSDVFSSCAGLSYSAGVNGVASVLQSDGGAYSYIITGDANSEFKVIKGGPGGSAKYVASGLLESATFDANHAIAWNYVQSTAILNGGSINYYLAISPVGGDGTCNSATFVFYQIYPPGVLQLPGTTYTNPGQCMRYRVQLFSSADGSQAPVLQDITFNYSL